MRYSKILTLALLLPTVMSGVACSDFLSLDPPQSVAADAYFKTMADFRAAIVGVYDRMQISDWYGRSLPLMSDIMGEDVKQNSSANRYQEFQDFEGQAISGHMYERELWAETYQGINYLNAIINAEFEPPSASQTEFNQILGEAYALRGLAYFDLCRMYAQHYTFTADAGHPGVPIVLEADVSALPARNTVKETYAQAIADLSQGMSLMTMNRNGPFMMSKAAAQAILSRIYLYMEDFSNSVAMADAVINSGKYSLVTGSAYLNQFVTGGSSEAIFELAYSPVDRLGNEHLSGMYRASGYGDYLPAKDLLNLIPAGDVRNQFFVVDPKLGGKYASMRVNKWPTGSGEDNIPIIRLSELYLNRAEAKARMGQDAGAQADLNVIRKRGLATAPNVTASGSALLEEILVERRIELGYEGHRVHDLMRHKRDVKRVDFTGDVSEMKYPCNFCILPIPFEELDVNPNMVQNTGYPTPTGG